MYCTHLHAFSATPLQQHNLFAFIKGAGQLDPACMEISTWELCVME
jgi:hypothetical protein